MASSSSSSKIMIALLFAFAVVSATLPPSVSARAQGFSAATTDESRHEAPAEPLLHPSAASTGTPALLGMFPPLPGLGGLIAGLLFPPLLPALLFPPLLPALLFPPLLQLPQQPAGSTNTASPQQQPTECMTPLIGMMPCTDYLTNLTVLTPPSACCDGLKKVISGAPICLCHGMNGGLNSFLPKPVDPVRMLVLPLACGTVLPLQTLFMCSSPQVPPIMPPAPTEPQPPTTPATPASP